LWETDALQPRIATLATAVPDRPIPQEWARQAAARVFGDASGRFARMAESFVNAGIDTRYTPVPLDWFDAPHDWADRNAVFVDAALDLLERAARACLDRAGVAADDIDAVVTVCSTGIATPSLETRLMARIPLRADAMRVPLFGLGCCGGALGLGRAATLARGLGSARVLLLVVELCSLTFRRGDVSKNNVIATALFGDGAAAALISTRPEDRGRTLAAWGEHCWPDTINAIGWTVESDGLGVVFSRELPQMLRENLRPATLAFLDRHGLGLDAIDRIVCHPGGAKILDAVAEAFALPETALAIERDILRRFGNMSSATVLFVLEACMAADALGRRSLLLGIGPGLTAGFVVLGAFA
jgi:alkylresorcinol/alkylpyrone synthase